MILRIILFLSLLVSSCEAKAQEPSPQEVHPITEVVHENDWYLQQAEAWKKKTIAEPTNAFAWYNRYKALRYADFPRIFRDTVYKAEVAEVVEEMGRAIPESFEYAYIRNWNAHLGEDAWTWLNKAHAIDPTRPEVYSGFLTRFELEGNWAKKTDYARQWYDTRTIAPSLLYLAKNMLESVDQNGILFTHGDNDTYPLWVLQEAKHIRPDVTVINLSLANDRIYFLKLMDHRQIRINLEQIEQVFDKLPQEEKRAWMIRHLEEMNQDRPVYIALTVGNKNLEVLEDQLWCTGLANRYTPEKIDNIAILRRNIEQRMLLDHLTFQPYTESFPYEDGLAQSTVSVYLTPFLTLTEHYTEAGMATEANRYRELARQVGRLSNRESEVETYLEKSQSKH
ncbi:MAG: hypothetical protein K9I85_13280 [Saprospiraceae bacterium]|nr:hypothetical protein [Saprospiraceae bacterium]